MPVNESRLRDQEREGVRHNRNHLRSLAHSFRTFVSTSRHASKAHSTIRARNNLDLAAETEIARVSAISLVEQSLSSRNSTTFRRSGRRRRLAPLSNFSPHTGHSGARDFSSRSCGSQVGHASMSSLGASVSCHRWRRWSVTPGQELFGNSRI